VIVMKKWIAVLVLSAAALVSATSCGGDPCEELADICAMCTDESTKSGCQAAANADDHDRCENGLSMYQMQCGG
jgi:hypothetical protein